MEERSELATACSTESLVNMPILIDQLSDDVSDAYVGLPDRLYLIDDSGRVAYRSEVGPEGFKPRRLQKAIDSYLSETLAAKENNPSG